MKTPKKLFCSRFLPIFEKRILIEPPSWNGETGNCDHVQDWKCMYQPGASSIAFWSWENLALMSSDLCFWNRDEEDDQQSPHWRKKETIKESRFFHLYFVDSKGCLFFNLVPPFTTFLKEERAQYVFILSFLMLLQREKSTKNKLLKKWQICSNNNKKKIGSKRLTSVTGVG